MLWYRQNHYRALVQFLLTEFDQSVGHFQSSLDRPPFAFSHVGETVTLQCEQDNPDYYNMFWYRQSSSKKMEMITYSVNKGISSTEVPFNQSKYTMSRGTFTVENLEPGDQGLYFCAVSQHTYFGSGTKLTVLDPKREITPPTVKVFQPSSKECRNLKDEKERKKTLLCVARDFYPDHVSIFWQVNAKNVTKGVATDPAARLDDKTYFITSRLRVHAEVWTSPGTNFSCFVTFFDGNKTIIKDETVFAVEGMFMWNSEIT
uniref:Ig-like domain-containing protein n=1 Tax=Seriola lalandi dorsalis TaxID=1841481 RepID=A0A3B4X7P9_SERLL